MAKAKKSTGEEKSKAADGPEAKKDVKKTAPKKAAAKSAAAKPAPIGTPMIDTNFAAQTAARMIGAKVTNAAPSGEGKKETSAFRQLRDSMTKGHSSSINSVLNSTMPQSAKKSEMPFRGGKQVGRNQTFGADVSKNSVPRRTGGG